MRIPKSWIPPMARRILDTLIAEDLVEPRAELEKLLEAIEALITEELSVEDRLNDEVRELLRRHEGEIDRGRLDYRKLFDLTKQKLARERNLVL
ncbi:MAG: DUF507 family protein [Thermodesulfovibrionales bacterium]